MLVPFCGKSVDLLWLAAHGQDVVGVEISEIAVRAFFDEHELGFENTVYGRLQCYRATAAPIRLYCGDYYDYTGGPFHALYDRGALVAVPATDRQRYVDHTMTMLEPDAYRMVLTLQYDQDAVAGPPFSVEPEEIMSFWPDLERVCTRNDIDTGSPKFRRAGLKKVVESVWTSA